MYASVDGSDKTWVNTSKALENSLKKVEVHRNK